LKPLGHETPEHDFRIDLIFGTAKIDETNGGRGSLCLGGLG
jgi:hypothetical protein